jgi:hypothetical protein
MTTSWEKAKVETIGRLIEEAKLGHDALGPVDSISFRFHDTQEWVLDLYDDTESVTTGYQNAVDILEAIIDRPHEDAYSLFWDYAINGVPR